MNTGEHMNTFISAQANSETNPLISQQMETLANVYSSHKNANKWIMMIDPEDGALKSLTNNNDLDTRKILRVHSERVKVGAESIQAALKKGTCSAVVLCKKLFAQQQIDALSQLAKQSNTDFIVLNDQVTVH